MLNGLKTFPTNVGGDAFLFEAGGAVFAVPDVEVDYDYLDPDFPDDEGVDDEV